MNASQDKALLVLMWSWIAAPVLALMAPGYWKILGFFLVCSDCVYAHGDVDARRSTGRGRQAEE